MKLEQLLEGVSYTLVQGSLELDIEDIIYDSRKAAPGRLFVCIVGTQRDSHDYAAQCVADGVTALVVQHDIDLSTVPGAAVLKVESSRYALALMSGNLFGNPSRRMTMIGVTGTKVRTAARKRQNVLPLQPVKLAGRCWLSTCPSMAHGKATRSSYCHGWWSRNCRLSMPA